MEEGQWCKRPYYFNRQSLKGLPQCGDTVSLQLKHLMPLNSLSSYMYTNPPGIMQAVPLSCLGPTIVTFNPDAQSRDLIRHSNSSHECRTQYDQSRDNFPKNGLNTFTLVGKIMKHPA